MCRPLRVEPLGGRVDVEPREIATTANATQKEIREEGTGIDKGIGPQWLVGGAITPEY